jgi:hypothetical protein
MMVDLSGGDAGFGGNSPYRHCGKSVRERHAHSGL